MENAEELEWNQAWSSMPSRRVLRWSPKLKEAFGYDFGEIVTVTLAQVPEKYLGRLYIGSADCPVCGLLTEEGERLEVSLAPIFTGISHLACGGFVHTRCFEECPLTDEPTGVPW